ncbi:hypothetical protein KR009_007606 [Drosophila setifemur]|nr:hypothetical protein KR009_007606 [Drosophila setifemur]
MFSPGLRSILVVATLLCSVFLVQAELAAEPSPGDAGHTKLLPSACRSGPNGNSSGPEIQLPFVDLVVRYEFPLFVLREPEQDLLLMLHGPELFQLHVASGERRLLPLGQLTGRLNLRGALAAEVVAWRQFLLIAVVLEDSLSVYQLPRDLLLSQDPDSQMTYEPVQEFSLPGEFLQLHLLKPSAEQVLLLVTSNQTRSLSKCRTFEWLETYFNPVEELSLPPIRLLRVVGRQPLYLIFGRSSRGSQAKLVLTVYEVDRLTRRLLHRQALTVQAQTVHAVRFRNRNCLIACSSSSSSTSSNSTSSSSSSCLFFRMVDGQFVVNRKHTRRDLNFLRMTATKEGQLLIGARANGEVILFSSSRLDCFSGFVVPEDPQPSGVMTHKNARNESFLLLAYAGTSSSVVLRTLQLGGVEETSNQVGSQQEEDLSVVQLHRHEFEDSINDLRSLLLRRRSSLETLRKLLSSLQQRSGIRLEQPLHLQEGGHIELLQLEGKHLRTPTQLKQRLEELRQRFGQALPRRITRSFGAGNDSDVPERLKVRRLKVGNLIYQGQLLPGAHRDDLAVLHINAESSLGYTLDSANPPLLTIRNGTVLTKSLHTEHLLTPKAESMNMTAKQEDIPSGNEYVVRHLQVTKINGVDWSEFLDSLFLRSRDTEVQGRLVFQSRSRVDSLQARLLNGLVVDQLFNLRRAQVVSSNIYMSAFFVPRLDARRVNGLDFAKDIVIRGGNDTWVKTPVRINQMSVSGSVQVANEGEQRARQVAEVLSPNTNPDSEERRLQQYYTGRVTIRGSLTVRNVERDTDRARLMLGNQSLARSDLHSQYLLDQTPQNISLLAFGHARVSAPSLTTGYIGGHPYADHLLSAGQQISQANPNHTLHIIFINASIQGDVLCRDYSSRLAEISRDAVRHGQEANITGHKRFLGPVTVQALQTTQLNDLPVAELVLKANPVQTFLGAKEFSRVVVTEELQVQEHLNVSRLNGFPVDQLLGHDLRLQRLELTEMPHLKELHFQRLNGLPFHELLSKISEGDEHSLLLRKHLLIEGNVGFEKPLQLKEINGLQWEDYLQSLVRPDANAEMSGRKSFLAGVQLSDALRAPLINGLDLSSLLDNTLLRMTPQEVGGAYSFGSIRASNVDVQTVNGVPREEFIDGRRDVLLKGDLHLQQLTINGSLRCPLANDLGLDNLQERVEQVRQLPWRNLLVTGDALWEEAGEDDSTQLEYLRQHAVRREGNQSIAGQVLLRQPLLENLQTRHSLPWDLNLTHLAQDALLRWTATNGSQEVTAPLELLGLVRARTLHLERDADFGQVNGIDIGRLNASLYRLSSGEAIAADLRFLRTPWIGNLSLMTPEVNGALLEEIYQQGQPLPRVNFRQLLVQQDLALDTANGMSLEYFLEHRVPLRGEPLEVFGSLSFENLQLGGRSLLRSINGIPLENLVMRNSNQVQTITGAKTFHGGVEFRGPGHVMNLNGRDLSESYRGSIFRDKDYNIDSLVLDRALFPGGLIQGGSTPHIPTRNPDLNPNFNPGQLMRSNDEANPLEELRELLLNQSSSSSRTSGHLLYLDHDPQLLEVTRVKSPLKGSPLILPLAGANPCQRRQLQVQLLPSQRRVLLANVSVHHQLERISSGEMRVKVHNHCPVRRLRSRISFSCRNESHVLGMRQPVEMMQLLNPSPEEALLLLGTEEEVRILRLNRSSCRLTDWQSVVPADGRLMKVVTLREEHLLLTSGMSSHRPVLALHARRRSPLEQRFRLLQLIPGAYDLAEIVEDQLLASCLGCRHIAIYALGDSSGGEILFEPSQQLSFQERIQQLTPFRVGEELHLLVLTQPGEDHFFLFTHHQVGGWRETSFGYKKQNDWSFPLVKSGASLPEKEMEEETGKEVPLVLLCGREEQCSLVKVVLR